MKNQAKEDVTKEFQIMEKASGSKDPQNYKEDPEASHPHKGKRGRPSRTTWSKHEKQMARNMNKQQEEPNPHSTATAAMQNKHLKAIANEDDKRTGSNVIAKT